MQAARVAVLPPRAARGCGARRLLGEGAGRAGATPARRSRRAVACGVPVLKEWEGVSESLGQGEKTLLVRKGGLSEGKGFELRSSRFLLFPTRFHESKIRAGEGGRADAGGGGEGTSVTVAAEVTGHWTISGGDKAMRSLVRALGEEAVLDRVAWRPDLPLHLVEVRAHRLSRALSVTVSEKFGGCSSWADLDAADVGLTAVEDDRLWEDVTAEWEAALNEAEFMARRSETRATLWRMIDETLWDAPPGLSVVDCAPKYKQE